MNFFKLLFLSSFFLFSSCSLLDHRDFSKQMDSYQENEPMFKAHDDFMIISGDSGAWHRSEREIKERTPASFAQRQENLYQSGLKQELKHLEGRLNEEEFFEFDRQREHIGGTSEQIYFLRLPRVDREDYLIIKKIKAPSQRRSRGYRGNGAYRLALYEKPMLGVRDDVVLGMSKDDVLGQWGKPLKRNIAGSLDSGNERWAFRRNGKTKYIYFEEGRVQGWNEE